MTLVTPSAGGPIVGFRCWALNLDQPVLKSVAIPFEWPPGQDVEAACLGSLLVSVRHEAPDEHCWCGLYALTTVDGCAEEFPYYPLSDPVHNCYWTRRGKLMVMGAVLMWGATLRGRRVIRSQYARVLCLTEMPDVWAPRSDIVDPSKVPSETVARRERTIEAICQRYSVPLVPRDAVEHYAAEFGDLVPSTIIGA
jgi:hypothetical protein